jgi:hypothetical protein
MSMKKIILITGIAFLLVTGCVETEPVSTIPQITFKSFDLFETYNTDLDIRLLVGVLEFSFIDGDANIGMIGVLNPFDTIPENMYNLFLVPYEKIDSNYIPIEIDTTLPEPYYRIMRDEKMDRTGQNKTIKGTITLYIQYYIVPEYDTMRYEFYIYDRAKNKSNVEVTSDIGFKGIRLTGSF